MSPSYTAELIFVTRDYVMALCMYMLCGRWVFAFQRSVALAMTKIMMAQANSSMHHSLGTSNDTLRQHDADEALFLQEAAVNEDDGWDTRRLTRTRNIMDGHANVLHAAKEGGMSGSWSTTKPSRSKSICSEHEMELQAAAAYKDRSFGDLSKAQDEPSQHSEQMGAVSTPSSPLRISWGRGQPQVQGRGGGRGREREIQSPFVMN